MPCLNVFVVAWSSAVAGTPWIQERGASYIKVSEQRFATTGFVAPDGTRDDSAQYVGFMTAGYAELGLGGGVQVMVSVPHLGSRMVVSDAAFVNRGVGDVLAGIAVGREWLAGLPVSLGMRAKLPAYDNAKLDAYGLSSGRFPALGDGQVDIDGVASVGTGVSAGPVRGWWLADVGYRHRTEWWLGDSSQPDRALADGMVGRVQVGWAPMVRGRNAGWVFAEVGGVKAFSADLVTRQFVEVAGGLAAKVGHSDWAVEAGGSRLLWTRAAAPGGAVSVGVSHQGKGRTASRGARG